MCVFKDERLAFVLTLCAVVACGRSDAPVQMKAARGGPVAGPTCGAGPTVLTGNGIGTLRIGRAAADVKRECEVVADTSVEDVEGTPQRVLFVALAVTQSWPRSPMAASGAWRSRGDRFEHLTRLG